MTDKTLTIVTRGGVVQDVYHSHCDSTELRVKIVDIDDLKEDGKNKKHIDEVLDLIKSDNWKIY